MANKSFIQEVSIQAKDIDSLNRRVMSKYIDSAVIKSDDIDGGFVFNLSKVKLSDVGTVASSTAIKGNGNSEIWQVVKPATGSLTGLWMAYNPEVKLVEVNGKEYAGLSEDVRDYTNIGGKPFDAFKLCVGDIIAIPKYALENYTTGTSTKLVAVNGSYKLNGSTSATSQASLKVIEERDVIFPKAGVGNEYVTMVYAQVEVD